MSVITVPPVLEDKLGHAGVQALVDLINASQDNFKEDIIEICEERFETRLTRESSQLRSEISDLRVELVQKMADLETRLTHQIAEMDTRFTRQLTESEKRQTQQTADLETRLIREIQNGRTETLKWMLLFWVGQFAVLIGILFAFFKH